MSWKRDRESCSTLFPSEQRGDSFGTPFLSSPAIEWMAFVPERQRFLFAVFKAYLSNICFGPGVLKGAVAAETELPRLSLSFLTSSLSIRFRRGCNAALVATHLFFCIKKKRGVSRYLFKEVLQPTRSASTVFY